MGPQPATVTLQVSFNGINPDIFGKWFSCIYLMEIHDGSLVHFIKIIVHLDEDIDPFFRIDLREIHDGNFCSFFFSQDAFLD